MTNSERIKRLESVVYDLSKYATNDCPWQAWSDSLYEFIKEFEAEGVGPDDDPEGVNE